MSIVWVDVCMTLLGVSVCEHACARMCVRVWMSRHRLFFSSFLARKSAWRGVEILGEMLREVCVSVQGQGVRVCAREVCIC